LVFTQNRNMEPTRSLMLTCLRVKHLSERTDMFRLEGARDLVHHIFD